ncbi:MAG: PHP domain-containing protein [bacterium]
MTVPNIDLHIHTNASDGTLTPSQVVAEAHAAGLAVISITDHDTTAGLQEAVRTARARQIVLVPGVEISATHPAGEAHILGYWVDYEDAAFQEFLSSPLSTRSPRIAEMCKLLDALGLPVDPEEVFREAEEAASVGRPHIARVMLRKGYVTTMDEAFDRFLGEGQPAYVKRFKNTTADTIAMIHASKGVSVIAHPGLIRNPALITSLIREGVMGIEVYCHDHDPEKVRVLAALAEEHGLVVTGGSDYHGKMLEKTFRLGDLRVPYACYSRLEEARERLLAKLSRGSA